MDGSPRVTDGSAIPVPPVLGVEVGTTPMVLRPWTTSSADVTVVLAASNEAEIRRYSSVGAVRDAQDAREWIASRRSRRRLDWALEQAGAVIGRVGLNRLDDEDRVAELGYWLLLEHRGKGLVTRAVSEVTQYAFTSLDVGRLEIRHESENIASCRVAQRCEFREEGTQRGAMLRGDVRLDLHLHARLVTD